MARNQTEIARTREQVFAFLSDPYRYEDWVVGSSEIRDVQGEWPDVGATFHHTQGVPKLGLKDTTTVLACEPPRRLLLCVRARPAVIAEVELTLRPNGSGTLVSMVEQPVGGLVGKLQNPLFDAGLRLRNAESLRRLKRELEGVVAPA